MSVVVSGSSLSSSARAELGASELRTAFGAVPSGVVAVCGIDPSGDRVGMAMSSFVPISLDPPLVAVSVQTTSRTWPQLRSAGALGLSVLGVDQGLHARQLAARDGDRFAGLGVVESTAGAVYIDDAAARFECSIEREIEVGDHVVVVLRVHSLDVPQAGSAEPLVFHRGSFAAVAPLPSVASERGSGA